MNLAEFRQDRSALLAELELAGAKIQKDNAIHCPFHDDQTPSAGIYQGKDGAWRFKCQSSECGVSGDLFDIRARVTGKPLAELLLEAAGKGQRQIGSTDKGLNASDSNIGQGKVFASLDDLRVALPGQVVTEHRYENPDTGKLDLIVFRCQVNGGKSYRPAHEVQGGFRLGAPEKPWPLYRRDLIARSETLVIVEGEKCVDVLSTYGIAGTTSSFGAGKAEHTDWTSLAGKNCILWPDHDTTGVNHMRDVQKIVERLQPEPSISWIEPKDLDLGQKEDIADLVQQLISLGKNEAEIKADLDATLGKAKPCRISEALRVRLDETVKGQRMAIDWPWPRLSQLSQSLLPETVTILCGDPGATKSFALLQALAFWFEKGIRVACLQLEENRTYHLHRVLAQREGNSELFNAEWIRAHPQDVQAAFDRHKDFMDRFGKVFWQRPESQPSLEVVARWVSERAEQGYRVIAVDPLSAAEPVAQVWIADSKFITACERAVERFGASLVLILHPRKGSKGAVGLDDLAGGASYQRLAQTIIWLERHKKPKDMLIETDVGRTQISINRTVHLCKTRNGPGHGLSLGYKFDGKTLLLSEQGVIIDQD